MASQYWNGKQASDQLAGEIAGPLAEVIAEMDHWPDAPIFRPAASPRDEGKLKQRGEQIPPADLVSRVRESLDKPLGVAEKVLSAAYRPRNRGEPSRADRKAVRLAKEGLTAELLERVVDVYARRVALEREAEKKNRAVDPIAARKQVQDSILGALGALGFAPMGELREQILDELVLEYDDIQEARGPVEAAAKALGAILAALPFLAPLKRTKLMELREMTHRERAQRFSLARKLGIVPVTESEPNWVRLP